MRNGRMLVSAVSTRSFVGIKLMLVDVPFVVTDWAVVIGCASADFAINSETEAVTTTIVQRACLIIAVSACNCLLNSNTLATGKLKGAASPV